uniref:Secreted protein n=1 Tax=Syphacia muris TaxID=451379 RepID=A0A0N5AFN3_9BILA
MWTVSSKTFHSWQRVLCCGLCSSAPAKNSSMGRASTALNRPLLPSAQPPPPPHHYLPMATSSAPSTHLATTQAIWKQSKVV